MAGFSYINGDLFAEQLPIPTCDSGVRDALLKACRFDWSVISPAIFGAMFQEVMDAEARRQLGAHYTSLENIMRTVRPLFLDELEADLERARTKQALDQLHDRLAAIRILDPACGCGNFLVISYLELRRLEHELWAKRARAARTSGETVFSADAILRVKVDQFYGIEIEEFPACIARTALYLADHLANLDFSRRFGQYFVRFPIPASPHIRVDNALRFDWNELLDAEQCSFIVGNPPFVGSRMADEQQKVEQRAVWANSSVQGKLDYVTNWYKLAAEYIGPRPIRAAFVSTNSISQGEQPAILWGELWRQGFHLDFAYSTFAWSNEASGQAAVHVVIEGFSNRPRSPKSPLWTFATPRGEPIKSEVRNISPYLIEGSDTVVSSRQQPLVKGTPPMYFGSMPRDNGILSKIDPEEAEEIRATDPVAARYLRRLIGADELIGGAERWCLWLLDASPAELGSSPVLRDRLAKVRRWRLRSKADTTRAAASTPGIFVQLAQPKSSYLAVPGVSSERRDYIPTAFFGPEVIASNALLILPKADTQLFGIISSRMFMAWNRTISGRLESRIRVSQEITYNNFPFPQLTDVQRQRLGKAAQAVLDARSENPGHSLATLYDPLTMPLNLVQAHRDLDRVVDSLFAARRRLVTDHERLTLLLARYEALASPAALFG